MDPNGPAPPAPISVADVWDLQARPDRIDQAAAGWRRMSAAVTAATIDVDAQARALAGGGWSGAATFDAHRRTLTAGLEDTADRAAAVAAALSRTAGSVRAAQAHLTDEWGRVIGVPLTYDSPVTCCSRRGDQGWIARRYAVADLEWAGAPASINAREWPSTRSRSAAVRVAAIASS
jgi:hypothetical protein